MRRGEARTIRELLGIAARGAERDRNESQPAPRAPEHTPIECSTREVWVAADGSEHRTRRAAFTHDPSRLPVLETRREPLFGGWPGEVA